MQLVKNKFQNNLKLSSHRNIKQNIHTPENDYPYSGESGKNTNSTTRFIQKKNDVLKKLTIQQHFIYITKNNNEQTHCIISPLLRKVRVL